MPDGFTNRTLRIRPARLFQKPRVQRIQLSHLAVGAPPEITVPGVPKVGLGDGLEAALRIELPRNLIGHGFIVRKPVGLRRKNGFLIELLRVEYSALNSRDLTANKRCSIFKVRRAMLPPYSELPMMFAQHCKMASLPFGRC